MATKKTEPQVPDPLVIDPAELPERTELVYVANRDQLAVILDAMQTARIGTWSNLMRLALDHYISKQLGVQYPAHVFALRTYRYDKT